MKRNIIRAIAVLLLRSFALSSIVQFDKLKLGNSEKDYTLKLEKDQANIFSFTQMPGPLNTSEVQITGVYKIELYPKYMEKRISLTTTNGIKAKYTQHVEGEVDWKKEMKFKEISSLFQNEWAILEKGNSILVFNQVYFEDITKLEPSSNLITTLSIRWNSMTKKYESLYKGNWSDLAHITATKTSSTEYLLTIGKHLVFGLTLSCCFNELQDLKLLLRVNWNVKDSHKNFLNHWNVNEYWTATPKR
jgi:hypothetical protein